MREEQRREQSELKRGILKPGAGNSHLIGSFCNLNAIRRRGETTNTQNKLKDPCSDLKNNTKRKKD